MARKGDKAFQEMMAKIGDNEPAGKAEGVMEPVEIDEVEFVFPAHGKRLLPAWEDIPAEIRFASSTDPYRILSQLLFNRIALNDPAPIPMSFDPKPGLDITKATRHIDAVMRSFEPDHDHKIAGVAVLMKDWFLNLRQKDSTN